MFTSTYDLSDYTESELREIRNGMGTLDAYVISKLIEERENLLSDARAQDKRSNYDVIVSCDGAYSRYHGLEDALRHILYGVCKLGYRGKELIVDTDGRQYTLKWITPAERIYVSSEVNKYSDEYLDFIYSNKLTKNIRRRWYNGCKDKNIKIYKEGEASREEDKGEKAQDHQTCQGSQTEDCSEEDNQGESTES